jgi:ribosomal protein L16 Arg81 hydroxylase
MELMMRDNSLDSIKSMLVQVINKQNDMDETLKEVVSTLSQLNQTVVGNPTYGQKGLITEINEIKEYVDKDKMIKNKILGGLAVIGVFWTMLFQLFIKSKN